MAHKNGNFFYKSCTLWSQNYIEQNFYRLIDFLFEKICIGILFMPMLLGFSELFSSLYSFNLVELQPLHL